MMPADGKVDAQPLYVAQLTVNGSVHNVTYVATEHDTVYAYDVDVSGNPLWQVTMLADGESPSDHAFRKTISTQGVKTSEAPAVAPERIRSRRFYS